MVKYVLWILLNNHIDDNNAGESPTRGGRDHSTERERHDDGII